MGPAQCTAEHRVELISVYLFTPEQLERAEKRIDRGG